MKKIIIAILSVLLIFTVISCNDAADEKLFIKAPKTITVKVKTGTTSLKVSSDSTPVAIGETEWNDAGLAAVTVKYYQGDTELAAIPTTAGTYKAVMSVAGVADSVSYDFTIN